MATAAPDGVSPSPVEGVFSRYLTEQLAQMSERPWSEVCRGRPINERWLTRTLGAFGIRSENIRIDEKQAKGYEKADFEDTFARYLPETGFLSVPPSRYEGKPPKSIRPKKENGTDEKSAPYIGKWDAGTDKKTGNAKTRALERPLIREAVEVFNGKIVT